MPDLIRALVLAAALPALASGQTIARIEGPRQRLTVSLLRGDTGRLHWQASFLGRPVLETSPLGMALDGTDLGQGVAPGRVDRYEGHEAYPWNGARSHVESRFQGAKVALRHSASGRDYVAEIRVFTDGFGLRFVVPGIDGDRRTPDAATTFTLPSGSTVWFHDLDGHYEGRYARKLVDAVTSGEWAAPPLTFRLPGGAGYASITEADLRDYSGMVLQADGRRGFRERLAHDAPVAYPFTLRYGKDEGERLAKAVGHTGTITTPWRVVLVGPDLHTLVNSDVVPSLCPPPDPSLFPQGLDTPWVRPGRAVWKYLDGGESTLEGMKEFSRLAAELGFEYNVVEGFWRRWSDAQLRELIDDASARKVGIWLWVHSKDLRVAEERRRLFEKLHGLGAVGLKVDFLDHEAREILDLYRAILKDAAAFRLMVDFHGSNKPTGEARSWPNELTREGIYGLEHRKAPEWAEHNTTLPFTRMLAGHADYTPVIFGERRKETSWTHQIASAAVFTSPLLVYGAHPKSLLENPASDVIRSVPSVWDETVVLEPSAIGELAVFARRRGDRWFLAILNGSQARSLRVPLAFLGRGRYRATLVRDRADEPAAVEMEERVVQRDDVLEVAMRGAGGFVARFSPHVPD